LLGGSPEKLHNSHRSFGSGKPFGDADGIGRSTQTPPHSLPQGPASSTSKPKWFTREIAVGVKWPLAESRFTRAYVVVADVHHASRRCRCDRLDVELGNAACKKRIIASTWDAVGMFHAAAAATFFDGDTAVLVLNLVDGQIDLGPDSSQVQAMTVVDRLWVTSTLGRKPRFPAQKRSG
jgi:hypothetical protein